MNVLRRPIDTAAKSSHSGVLVLSRVPCATDKICVATLVVEITSEKTVVPTDRTILVIVAVFVTMVIGGCCSPRNNCYVLEPNTWDGTGTPISAIFSRSESKAIRAYYYDHYQHESSDDGRMAVPPTLPTDNVRKKERLPPGLVTQPLPSELTKQLPAVLDGYERVVVPSTCKVLLIWVEFQQVADVLDNVHTKRDCRGNIES